MACLRILKLNYANFEENFVIQYSEWKMNDMFGSNIFYIKHSQ